MVSKKSAQDYLSELTQKTETEFIDTLKELQKRFAEFLETSKSHFRVPARIVRGVAEQSAFEAFKNELRAKNYSWEETYDNDDDTDWGYHFPRPEFILTFEFNDSLAKYVPDECKSEKKGEPLAKKVKLQPGSSTEECMICMERKPDTTVIPCMHSVVCSVCSPKLENGADAKICCQCRCKITGIYYPDNTVKEI